MPNVGHTWTKQKEQMLWDEWTEKKEEYKSKRKFSISVCDKYGASVDAIRIKLAELETKPPDSETGTFEQGEDFINVICSSPRMITEDDVIERFKIDTQKWELDKFRVKTSEGYRKDRRVQWKVEDGKVLHGDVDDSGKILVVPMYHVDARFKRKTEEIRARLAVDDIKADAAHFAPKYTTIKYPKFKNGFMYEISMPDIHFGRLSWHEESGIDYDVKIAEESVRSVLAELLTHCKNYDIEKILFPLGNDYFNVDSKANTTTRGTPQQEDTRWQKTFRIGRQLAVEMIETCQEIAPVDVLIIKGNHDVERSFYLGDALECWFHNNKSVSIDNAAIARKYYLYGKSLIGFTHGSEETQQRLPMLMPTEVPDLWAKSKYREFHCGDKHHKFDTSENGGVVIRILRSLAAVDAWTFEKGFVGALRAAEAFLWDKEYGLKAQFTAQP